MSVEPSSQLLRARAIHDRLQQIAVACFGAPVTPKQIRYEHIERNPYQHITGVIEEELPRYVYDEGLPHAFWVRSRPNKAYRYELLFGIRWVSAAYRAGHDRMPCTLIAADDATYVAFGWLEGLLHGTIPLLQQAAGIQWLLDHGGFTIPTLAEAIDQPPEALEDCLALLAKG